jgi:lipopolysaccharide transport system permease protein
MKKEDHWDLIIKPQTAILDLRLKEVWKYRDLLMLFVRRDFVAFFKQTVLGPAWFFIQPIFTTFIYVFIFGNLAGIPTDGIPEPVFYLSGIIAWSYFSECMTKTSNVFRDNVGMFGKVYFPRLVVPLSIVISSLLKFGVQLLLLLLLIIYYIITGQANFNVTWYLAWFPLLVVLMAIQGLGFGMIVSSLTTKYRDLALLVGFAMPLLMYATPIVYPLSTLGGNLKLLISANPLTPIIEGIRLGFFGKGVFDIYSLIYVVGISIVVLFAGVLVFNKVGKSFVDTV